MKILLSFLFCFYCLPVQAQPIRIGAKHFNEGYILSEITAQLLESNSYEVERTYNLGGTLVCFEALRNGAIDLYPEYSGTLAAEILKSEKLAYDKIEAQLEQQYKLSITKPIGFNNTYALVVKKTLAEQMKLATILDLKDHPTLKAGVSYEFLKRLDGWENLSQAYGLTLQATGLEHGLAYQALQENKIDLTDAYSTDGEITANNLLALKDNLDFFPDYAATILYRMDLPKKVVDIISMLENRIDENRMQTMNAAVLFEKKSFAEVASNFLLEEHLVSKAHQPPSDVSDVLSKMLRHLMLTLSGLMLAVFLAIPLGIFLYWQPRFANPTLYITGLLQTIPSIALLAVMIPLFGIGLKPAIVALFLYALLPILRNILIGLQSVDPLLKNIANGMGMTQRQKLWWIELPLAMPTVLAGVRTAAVINVGTATLAAFIGAGGLGEFIVTGLALNDTNLILRGALPAAGLALFTELFFEIIEKSVVLKHLRNR
jgi:osmoprotectant transport system permease protein